MKRVEGENREKAAEWLRAVELHECPICGSDEGAHAGGILQLPMIGPAGENPAVLAVPLTCLTCGYLFFFNAMRHWGGPDVSVG